MAATLALEATLRRDRLYVLAALVAVGLLAWVYLVDMAAGMDPGALTRLEPWTLRHFVMMFGMWAIMMVGMMAPSVAPVVLIHARVCRRRAGRVAPTGSFLLGYLVVWTAYSLGATGLQWGLAHLALSSPMMAGTSAPFGGAVLVAAGLYQLTPWKYACLEHCRSPLDYVAHHWRDGALGALRMGLGHGAYCVGCCWSLMLVLFVVGIMDLLWVAAIAGFVLLEKVAPAGGHIARTAAAALIIAGVALPVLA